MSIYILFSYHHPTLQETEELVAFLPQLYADEFTPVIRWSDGNKDKSGVIHMRWPEYTHVVNEFFQTASKECWYDYSYSAENAANMLEEKNGVETGDLNQIKTMLTFCVRGERFCDGHWSAMIEEGHIWRILERLSEMRSEIE